MLLREWLPKCRLATSNKKRVKRSVVCQFDELYPDGDLDCGLLPWHPWLAGLAHPDISRWCIVLNDDGRCDAIALRSPSSAGPTVLECSDCRVPTMGGCTRLSLLAWYAKSFSADYPELAVTFEEVRAAYGWTYDEIEDLTEDDDNLSMIVAWQAGNGNIYEFRTRGERQVQYESEDDGS